MGKGAYFGMINRNENKRFDKMIADFYSHLPDSMSFRLSTRSAAASGESL